MSFDDMVRAYGHVRYDWLPGQDAVPKEIGDKIPAAHLRSLNVIYLIIYLLNVFHILKHELFNSS